MEHLTVGTNSKNRTEEQYPLGFWVKKLIRSNILLKKLGCCLSSEDHVNTLSAPLDMS